jgi:hypothetical protein
MFSHYIFRSLFDKHSKKFIALLWLELLQPTDPSDQLQWQNSCSIRSQTYPDSSLQWSETILFLHLGEWKNWMKLNSWWEKLLENFEGEDLYLLSFSEYMILQWSPLGYCSMCNNSVLVYQWNSVSGLSNLIVAQMAEIWFFLSIRLNSCIKFGGFKIPERYMIINKNVRQSSVQHETSKLELPYFKFWTRRISCGAIWEYSHTRHELQMWLLTLVYVTMCIQHLINNLDTSLLPLISVCLGNASVCDY